MPNLPDYLLDPTPEPKMPCPDCDGHGMKQSDTCVKCDGSGEVDCE